MNHNQMRQSFVEEHSFKKSLSNEWSMHFKTYLFKFNWHSKRQYYPRHNIEAEWARMPLEWKFVVHSWIFEVHSKNSDCIQSAFQIFEPILVTGPNVFIMLKTFEVHSKWKNIELHSDCILNILTGLTAFQQHSKHSDRLRRRIETASHFKSCQNVPNAPRMSRNAPRMHFDCCRNLFRYYKNSARMQFKCRRNLSIAARMRLEFSRTVPIGPRMSPDVIQNTAESHI